MMNLTCPIMNVEALLPHSGKMVLLDSITHWGDDFIEAKTTLRADNLLLRDGKFDCFSTIELMAQAIGAWSGCHLIEQGESIRLGYLLGARQLALFCQTIDLGTTLRIEAKMSIQDQTGFSVFDCCVKDEATDRLLAQAALNVYSPKEQG